MPSLLSALCPYQQGGTSREASTKFRVGKATNLMKGSYAFMYFCAHEKNVRTFSCPNNAVEPGKISSGTTAVSKVQNLAETAHSTKGGRGNHGSSIKSLGVPRTAGAHPFKELMQPVSWT